MSSIRSASKCEWIHKRALEADIEFLRQGKVANRASLPTRERPMNRIRTHAFVMLGWIAVLVGSIAAADARPFDRMVGCWSGPAQLYDPNGAPAGPPTSSTGSVTWKTPYT